MQFQFFPLRFEFLAREALYFPPGNTANILRGALGILFRRIACTTQCQDTRTCAVRQTCPYARVFEPRTSLDAPQPSGLSDMARPFVFRARHLDARTLQPGDSFHFDLHVFSLDPQVLTYFVRTFAALADEGLGSGRAKIELRQVRCLALDGTSPEQTLYPAGAAIEPVSLDLDPATCAPQRIRVEFLSPTELKHEHTLAIRPEFGILFARLRDRISTLRSLYGPGPLDIDFRGMAERAAAVNLTRCEVRREESVRRSTRTGQTHSLGGWVGVTEYEGVLGEFLPYLEAGRWTGVGRQAVWGKGEIAFQAL